MSTKITVPLVTVTIRRDANTIIDTTVPPYELTILRQMFGKENVTERSDEPAGFREVEPHGEHERMSAKYGAEKIVKVYGDDGGERLAELVERAALKDKPARAKKGEQPATETTE